MSSLSIFLEKHGIAPLTHSHQPVMTVAEAEQLLQPLPGAMTKNLFLRDHKGRRHFLVTVPHTLAVDLAARDDLGRFAGVDVLCRRFRFALLFVLPVGDLFVLVLTHDEVRKRVRHRADSPFVSASFAALKFTVLNLQFSLL